MRNTRLSGHALWGEGSPYKPGEHTPWVRAFGTSSGAAVCTCGEASGVLESNAARQQWHRDHKEAIRNG
jgi:hypothetical protein